MNLLQRKTYTGMMWRGREGGEMGPGFWFRVKGYGLSCSLVTSKYHPLFSERYGGQYGIPKCLVAYISVGFGRRLRVEWLRP